MNASSQRRSEPGANAVPWIALSCGLLALGLSLFGLWRGAANERAHTRARVHEMLDDAFDLIEVESSAVQPWRRARSTMSPVDRERLALARRKIDRAIELDPDSPNAQRALGVALAEGGSTEESVAQFERAITLQPRYATAFYNLGNSFLSMGRAAQAIEAYQRAIQISPQHSLAYTGLGNALRAQGKSDAAIAAYRKAIELAPKQPFAYYGL